jgi:hypothetical protein
MKTRSLYAGAVRAVLISVAAAILAACAPPLDNRAEGNLRIILPGGASSAARAAIDPPADVSYYQLDFFGPGGETRSETLQSGTGTLTLTLNLGQWTIRVVAFTTARVPYGSGETTVTVETGRINEAAITMKANRLLAGTVTVVKPDNLVLTDIWVTAYKEAERTTDIGRATLSPDGEWVMEFPASSLAGSGTAWFRVSATDGTNSYTVDAGDSGPLSANGITNLDLPLAIYRITIDPAIAEGRVTADKSCEAVGNTISLTITPDANYRLKSGTLTYSDGTDEYPIAGTEPDYAFTMPAFDVTISAFFNRVLGFTIEGPGDLMVSVTTENSAGGTSTEISWSADESVTFTLESSDYQAEDGNLKWIVNGTEISDAGGKSLVIRARDYVQRSYMVTVMIREDGQWYSTEIPFEVTE